MAAGPVDGIQGIPYPGKPTPTECLIPGYSIPESPVQSTPYPSIQQRVPSMASTSLASVLDTSGLDNSIFIGAWLKKEGGWHAGVLG